MSNSKGGVGILFIEESGPTVVVRSVVRNGPAANSVRPPLPGDVLVKVDGYDVRGFSLTQLRSWLTGEEGSVVLLSFDGPGGRFDTSIVRAVNGSSSSSAHNGRSPPHEARRESTPDYESWRRDPLYNLVDSDAPQSPAYHDEHEHGMSSSPRRDDYESESWKGTGKSGAFPGPATSHGLARTSWAAEADKILAEAQAKIEDALHRERLLQETLDMLREKNEAKMRVQKDTRARLEVQRNRLQDELEEERDRFRWEGKQRDAINTELRKSEQRLFQLTSHLDRDGLGRSLL